MCLENTLLKTRFCLNWDCHNPNHLALKWPKGAASALQIGCQNRILQKPGLPKSGAYCIYGFIIYSIKVNNNLFIRLI
jgi:hypothetical protein